MSRKSVFRKMSRRQMLAGGAVLAGAGLLSACGQEGEKTLKIKDILGAEKLAGVKYTEAEREQLLESLEDHLERLHAIRTLKQPNQLAPAMTFDPRLPGRDYQQGTAKPAALKTSPAPLPASERDIAHAPLSKLSHWLQSGQISALDLTELYLKRIRKFAPSLECFVTITAELARTQARKADKELKSGHLRGPLHGIPYALKDLFDTKGIKTTWGAAPYQERVPEKDAWIVKKLEDAGAVLLGKATSGAIAYGDVWFGGRTKNPWNPDEGSSGSSAGPAAAAAAGLCGFAIGTETLGSIISPSNRCGTAGLRPTFGRVPRTGGMALCWSLDKIGPIGRRVSDTLPVLEVLNGYDYRDPGSLEMGFADDPPKSLTELTVGFDPSWFEGEAANPVDINAFEALKALGVRTRKIKIPERPYGGLLTILLAEAAAAFEELTEENLDDLLVWQGKDAWPNSFREARFIPAVDMINADRLRRTVMEDMDKLFDEVDLIAGPNFASSLLTITNFTGHPQLSFRAGFFEAPDRGFLNQQGQQEDSNRVPRNFSLWAPLFQEKLLVRVGRELEEKLGAYRERPQTF